MGFRTWLRCPSCSADGEVGVLAYQTEIVLECYECGHTAEFTIGRDVPLQDLDAAALEASVDEGVSE